MSVLANPFNVAVLAIVGIAYTACHVAVTFSPKYDSVSQLIQTVAG